MTISTKVDINDIKVLELKKRIEEKKRDIARIERFNPYTNCLLELEGKKRNLNVMSQDELTNALILLHSYHLAAKDLNIPYFKISGFSVTEWKKDIKAKLDIMNLKTEKQNLRLMEERLDTFLSAEKRVELELHNMEKLIDEL